MEWRRRAWIYTSAVGLVLSAAYFAMPDQRLHDMLYSFVGVASCVLVVVGIKIHHPIDRFAWYLIATAVGLFALGDLASD